MECPPIPQFNLDFSLKLIWKRAHLAQALQIGNFHCLDSLRMWWAWFTHTTRCKLHCCTVVYTSTRCLAHNVVHCLYYIVHCAPCSAQYWGLQCRPTPQFVGTLPMGPFLGDYGTCPHYYTVCESVCWSVKAFSLESLELHVHGDITYMF